MRRYKNEQEKLPEQVICNGCGRELRLERGYLKEGCFQADTIFGYFSKKTESVIGLICVKNAMTDWWGSF